jgi:hypothetical protein
MTFEELSRLSPMIPLKLGTAKFVVSRWSCDYEHGRPDKQHIWVRQLFDVKDGLPDHGNFSEFEFPPNLWPMLELVE